MKKATFSFVISLAIFTFAVVFINYSNAQAQDISCPAGFTCTKNTTTSYAYATPSPTPTYSPSPVTGSCYAFTTNLTVGSTGADVVALQTWLIANGYDIPAISSGQASKGRYGSQTSSALARLQANITGNNEDGYFGPVTRAKLSACPATSIISTNINSPIRVLNPNGGTFDSSGQINVQWTSYTGNFDYYQLILGNTTAGSEVRIDDGYHISKNQNSYNTFALWTFVNQIAKMSGYSADALKDTYYVKVNAVRSSDLSASNDSVVNMGISNRFSIKIQDNTQTSTGTNSNPILNPSNNYRPTGTVALGSAISVSLTSTNEDKVGAWENFGPGKAYGNQNPADYGFTANLTLSQTARTIKAITIFYNYRGEGCSTSRDFSTFGVDPYPMVVFKDGVQQNSSYDAALGNYQPGMYSLKLYCQPEATPFNGGKLLITFTDGTYVTTTIDASGTTPQLPNSNYSFPQPQIDSIAPSAGPIGTTIELKGSNLAGFEGDLDAWIQNSNGEVGFLPGIGSVPRTDQIIRVKIDGRLCQANNGYSGLPCKSYLTITPGTYKIYASPWGKRSNQVQFTVTPVYASPSPTPYYSTSPSPSPSTGVVGNSTVQVRTEAVNKMFKQYLGRLPDQQGLNYFVNSSLTIDQVRQIIVGSPEYKSKHASDSVNTSPSPTPSPSPTIY